MQNFTRMEKNNNIVYEHPLAGMRSKSRVGFQDSPEPALTTNEELMSVQHNKNLASHVSTSHKSDFYW